MAKNDLGFLMVDADHHIYEGRDAFTRYLDPAYRRRAHWITTDYGHEKFVLGAHLYEYVPNPTFDPISIPGSLTEMYKGNADRNTVVGDSLAGYRFVEPLADRPEYQDKELRLKLLDQQGVEKCLLFPTLSSGFEQAMSGDAGLTYAVLEAFNRWLVDEWPFGHEGRLYSMPQISLMDLDRALLQLEHGLAHGARCVLLRAAPVPCSDGDRSPGDPRFDPFWARLTEAGAFAVFHASDAGYMSYANRWSCQGRDSSTAGVGASALEFVTQEGRPISDLLAALICHGVFARFPGLRVMTVENGSDWVPLLVQRLAKNYKFYPDQFDGDPVEQFQRHVYVSPHWEEDLQALSTWVDAEHMVAGSDFPHPEGLAEPTEYEAGLADFDEAERRRILRENTDALLCG